MSMKLTSWIPAFGLFIALAAVGAGVLLVPQSGSGAPRLEGTILNGKPAPDFRLRDQFGRSFTLREFRGNPVVLTFLRSHSRTIDPVVAEALRQATTALDGAGRRIPILVVSTDPKGDTAAAVRSFSQSHGLHHRWHYLTGSRRQLAPVWHAYYIYAPPPSAPASVRDQHSSAIYLIDGQGRERVFFASSLRVALLIRDLRILAGLPVTTGGTSSVPAPEVGHPAPDFTLPAVHGPSLALHSFRGKVVLINFWATWCPACRREMPDLMRWYRRLKGQGFVVLGVDKQESRDDVAVFLQRLHITYPVVLDGDGTVSARYTVLGIPTSFLVDRRGVVQAVKVGVVDVTYLRTQVRPLLAMGR